MVGDNFVKCNGYKLLKCLGRASRNQLSFYLRHNIILNCWQLLYSMYYDQNITQKKKEDEQSTLFKIKFKKYVILIDKQFNNFAKTNKNYE